MLNRLWGSTGKGVGGTCLVTLAGVGTPDRFLVPLAEELVLTGLNYVQKAKPSMHPCVECSRNSASCAPGSRHHSPSPAHTEPRNPTDMTGEELRRSGSGTLQPSNGLAWVETSLGRERKEVGRCGHHFNWRTTEGLSLGTDITKATVETVS